MLGISHGLTLDVACAALILSYFAYNRSSKSPGSGSIKSMTPRLWACSASGLSTSMNRSMAWRRDCPGASGPPGSVVMCGAPSSAHSESARTC